MAAFGLAWVVLGLVVGLFDPVVPVGGLVVGLFGTAVPVGGLAVVFVVAGGLFAAGFFSSWQAPSNKASAVVMASAFVPIGCFLQLLF